MNKLPSDYTFNDLGINARFVNEDDAEFIVELRTDNKKAQYISHTDSSVEKQREWIIAYKEREKQGIEYYFHISCEGKPAGVIRIYNIKDNNFEIGSIVMKSDNPAYCVLATTIMAKIIAFEILDLKVEKSECYAENRQVVKFQKRWGKTLVSSNIAEVGENLVFRLTKEDYLQVKPKKVRQLQLIMG